MVHYGSGIGAILQDSTIIPEKNFWNYHATALHLVVFHFMVKINNTTLWPFGLNDFHIVILDHHKMEPENLNFREILYKGK